MVDPPILDAVAAGRRLDSAVGAIEFEFPAGANDAVRQAAAICRDARGDGG